MGLCTDQWHPPRELSTGNCGTQQTKDQSVAFQALQTMLDQEMWRQLPMPPGRQPDFSAALKGSREHHNAQSFDTSSFPAWVAVGNPWKRQDSGARICLPHPLHLSLSFFSIPAYSLRDVHRHYKRIMIGLDQWRCLCQKCGAYSLTSAAHQLHARLSLGL